MIPVRFGRPGKGYDGRLAGGRGMMAHATQRPLPRSFVPAYESPAHRPVPARRSEPGGAG